MVTLTTGRRVAWRAILGAVTARLWCEDVQRLGICVGLEVTGSYSCQ